MGIMASFEDACNQLLVDQYSASMDLFQTICFAWANGVATKKEASFKSQKAIAREKAMACLQTQCLIKGGDFVLGLSCQFSEYKHKGSDLCVCTFVGCVAQRSDVSDDYSSTTSDYEGEDELQMAQEDSLEVEATPEHCAQRKTTAF